MAVGQAGDDAIDEHYEQLGGSASFLGTPVGSAYDIAGGRALCHKKFSGDLPLGDGTTLSGSRQTLYRLHKQRGVWRIVGFIGYLPLND